MSVGAVLACALRCIMLPHDFIVPCAAAGVLLRPTPLETSACTSQAAHSAAAAAAAQRGGVIGLRQVVPCIVYRSHLASGPCRRWVRGMHRLLQHGARMVAGWPYRAVCLLAREGGHSAAAEGSVSAVASHRIAVGASFLRQTHSSRAPH